MLLYKTKLAIAILSCGLSTTILLNSTVVFAGQFRQSKSSVSRLLRSEGLRGREKQIERENSARSGKIQEAIDIWEEEAMMYRERKMKPSEIEILLKISQAYINLGQFYSALEKLEKAVAISSDNSHLSALIYKRLGHAYAGIGKYEGAIDSYKLSLQSENNLSTINNLVEILYEREKYYNFLARESLDEGDRSKYNRVKNRDRDWALKYAKQALKQANGTSLSSIRALINWSIVSQQKLSFSQLHKGRTILNRLPKSRSLVFLLLKWSKIDNKNRIFWLKQAWLAGQSLGDARVQSYVALEWGYLYEKESDLSQALKMASIAQKQANSEFAYDASFRAHSLAGKIYQKINNSEAAINAYRNAMISLELLNSNSLKIDLEQRINFQTKIEPIYRETLEMLLSKSHLTSSDLLEAIEVFDKLRLAQLQNYFGDDCFEVEKKNFSLKAVLRERNAALINSIILRDKVFFVLQLPDGKVIASETEISRERLIENAKQWYRELTTEKYWSYRDSSSSFFDLIIRPFISQLESYDLDVLVFVHDGILRNLPMAALFDGEKYLAQRWATVASIGLNFTTTAPPQDSLKTAAFGLSMPRFGWSKLSNVEKEIAKISELVDTKEFINDAFTTDSLKKQLTQQEYSVVHLATHGYFGGTAETSFVLAYDRKISAINLDNILVRSQQVIDLLVLSACETVVGNEYAILGLGGIAARSGVATVLGSLWQIDDDDILEVVEEFYYNIEKSQLNKAISLQKMQIAQIEKLAHPQKWAAFNLIGDF